MADNKVLFTLELQQKGDKISVVQKQTDKLAQSTKNVEGAEKKRNKTAATTYSRQKQGIIQTANSTKNFSKLAGSIDGGGGGPGGLVRAYALLAANVFALSAAFNVFSRAAQIDTLVDSMRQLEIVSGKSIMSVARNLQEATGFGMSFAESMRSTSLALSAGFDSSQISALGAVARNAAVSLGRNLPDALDRIFRGVIKVEPELLDEIGLFVRVNDASAKYAATIGKSVGDLTEFEKRQAFLNEALDQGTTKFAAFADVENDPFALLATTFADISQAVLSFLNGAIGPTVRFLSENKLIFSTIFGAIAFTLLKMAIPAMGAFTNSIAANAATAKKSIDAQNLANTERAKLSRQQHLEFLEDELQKQKALSATARATSQGATITPLAVKGKSHSKSVEATLKAELTGKGRLLVINERIANITTRQGRDQRMTNEDVRIELDLLRQEALVLNEQLATQKLIDNIDQDTFEADEGSLNKIETSKLSKKAIMSEGLAKVVNTAQTKGFTAAQGQLSIQLKLATAELAKEGIVLGVLDRIAFRVTGTIANLGVAFQSAMSKLMPYITGILMLLPLLKKLAEMAGFNGEASQAMGKAMSEVDSAMELLGPRLDHINKQFKLIGDDFKGYNKGLETFKETILSTSGAINESIDALQYYKDNAKPIVQFFEEFLSGFTFGLIDTVEEKVMKSTDVMMAGIKESKFGVTKEMGDLIREIESMPVGDIDSSNLNKQAEARARFKLQKQMVKLANEEAKGVRAIRSAIDGAADSARAFTNAFIKSTNFDKPLASLRQLNAALVARRQLVDDEGNVTQGGLLLSEQERLNYAKEYNQNQALRAMMTREEREELNATVTAGKGYLKVLEDIEDRFFRQQQIILRIKSEQAEITAISTIYAKSQKVVAATAESIIKLERRSSDLTLQKSKALFESVRSGTALTTEQIKQFALSGDLLDFENDKLLKGEDSKQVQAAIGAFKEREILLLQQAVKSATQQERIELSRATIALKNLGILEKINKIELQRQTMAKTAAKFRSSGETDLTGSEQIDAIVEAEASRLKTAKERLALEIKISNLTFKIMQMEMAVMKARAIGKRQDIAAFFGESVKSFRESLATYVSDEHAGSIFGSMLGQFLEMDDAVDSMTTGMIDIGNASASAATLITNTFAKEAESYLDKLTKKLKSAVPGSSFDAFDASRDARTTGSAITAAREDTKKKNKVIEDEHAKSQARIAKAVDDGILGAGEALTQSEAADKVKTDDTKANTDAQTAFETASSINLLEQNLLDFADSITSIFGDEGVVVAALANVSANMLNVAQNFGENYDKEFSDPVKNAANKVSTITATAAAAIGGLMQISAAQAKQQVNEVDKLIAAEERLDGKSAASVNKIKALEAKKEAIKRKAFDSNKKMMLAQAVMSTAAGIASAMVGPPGMPWSAGFAIAAGAMGLMQINLIKGMTYQGGGGEAPKANTALTMGGGRTNTVDVAKNATAGELSYLRGQKGIGTTSTNFTPGGATGKKGYFSGQPINVGEQGPEQIVPAIDIIPNEDMGRGNGATNINFSISAVDGASVQSMLNDQQGNIIQMIRQAANENGTDFLPTVDASVYNGK